MVPVHTILLDRIGRQLDILMLLNTTTNNPRKSFKDYLASDSGVKLPAASLPNTRGYVFDWVRFEKVIAEPYKNKNQSNK